MLLTIGLIITIIVLVSENGKLKDQVWNLSKTSKNEIKSCPYCGKSLIENKEHHEQIHQKVVQTGDNKVPSQEKMQTPINSPKIIKNKSETKNNLILVTGAVLVILSAILFLATTWSTSTNYIKTIVLVLMFIVFLATSKIAKDVMHLPQTSKAFYYIALFYLPILFFSISLFGLFGPYLSINGEGKYVFLSIGSIIVSIIYYLENIKQESILLKCSSYVFQVLSVIALTMIFTTDVYIIIASIMIYDIILKLLTEIYETTKDNIIYKVIKVIFGAATILYFRLMVAAVFESGFTATTLISSIIYFVSLIVIAKKDDSLNQLYDVLMLMVYQVIIYNILVIIQTDFAIIVYFLMISIICYLTVEILLYDKVKTITFTELLCYIPLTFIASSVNSTSNEYIIFIILLISSIIAHIFNDDLKQYTSSIIPLSLLLCIGDISYRLEVTSIIPLFISMFILLITQLKNIEKTLKESFNIITTIAIIIFTFLTIIDSSISPYITTLVLLITAILYYLLGYTLKQKTHAILSYLYINILLFSAFDTFKILEFNYLIIPIATILILGLSYLKEEIYIKEYLIFQFVLSYLYISMTNITIEVILTGIILSFLYLKYVAKENTNLKYIGYLGIIPVIYFNSNAILPEYHVISIISILLIGITTCLSYTKKNINNYSYISFIYIFFHATMILDNQYIILAIILASCTIHYLINELKIKDVFKFLIYLFGLITCECILQDLELINYTSLSYLLIIIATLLTTRTIIKKYTKDYKLIEYLALIFVGLITKSLCYELTDAMMLILFLLGGIIIGYIKKYGPLFLCSIIFMILTVFSLTKEFWLNISWWIYVLAIGSVLIIFAINNEAKMRQGNNNNKFKELKDKFDL